MQDAIRRMLGSAGVESRRVGHEIVYCTLCGERVVEADFEKGGAFRVERTIACGKCRVEALAALTPAQRAAVERPRQAPPPPAHAPPPPPTRRVTPAAKPGSPMPVIVAAVAIGVVVIVAMLAWKPASSGGPAPAPAPTPTPTPARPNLAAEEHARRLHDVQRALDDARALQTAWESRPAVLEAFARATGAAGSDRELAALVQEARRDYDGRFEQAARDATRPGFAAEEYADVASAYAAMAPVFAESEAGRQLKARVESLRRRLAIGEWRPVFDGASLAGWTRYVAGPKIKTDNWKIESGALLGTSSFDRLGKGTSDEFALDEMLTDYELEITWTAFGEPADGSVAALIVLPRIVFEGGKRVNSRGFARSTSGKKLTATMAVAGGEAEFRVDGRAVGKQPIAAARGRLCLGLTPGLRVRIESVRLKRLK